MNEDNKMLEVLYAAMGDLPLLRGCPEFNSPI